MESATANRSLPPWSALLSSRQHAFVLGWQRCSLLVCETSDTPYSREILYVILTFRWKRHTKNLSVEFPFDVCRGGVQKLWCGHRLHPTMYQALAQCGYVIVEVLHGEEWIPKMNRWCYFMYKLATYCWELVCISEYTLHEVLLYRSASSRTMWNKGIFMNVDLSAQPGTTWHWSNQRKGRISPDTGVHVP